MSFARIGILLDGPDEESDHFVVSVMKRLPRDEDDNQNEEEIPEGFHAAVNCFATPARCKFFREVSLVRD
jgi:hypothetical protein